MNDTEKQLSATPVVLDNVFAEAGVLALMLAWPEWAVQVVDHLRPDDFGALRRGTYEFLADAARLARQDGRVPDYTDAGLAVLLQTHGWSTAGVAKAWADVGRDIDLYRRALGKYDSAHGWWYIQSVQASARHRRLFDEASRLPGRIAATGAVDVGGVLASSIEQLTTILQTGHSGQGMQLVGEGSLGSSSAGLMPSVLWEYFSMLGGLCPGTLHVIAARTNVGKSALLQAVAVDLAVRQSVPVLVLDSEMERDAVFARSLASLTGADERALRQGYTDQTVVSARTALLAAPLYHLKIGGLASGDIFARMRQFRQMLGGRQGLIVLDYVKTPADIDPKVPEFAALGRYASDVKDEAGRLGLPILAGVQENRSGIGLDQKRRANGEGLGAVSGSDRISHVCDSVAGLRNVTNDEAGRILQAFGARDDYTGHVEVNKLRFNQVLHVNKNRSGPTLEPGLPVYFRKGTSRFEEVGQEERHWLHSGGTMGAARSRAGLPSVRTMRLAT